MTALAARGHSIRAVRTGIELTVLLTGWLLGGTVGLGTILYALAIGPIAHASIPRLQIRGPRATGTADHAHHPAPGRRPAHNQPRRA